MSNTKHTPTPWFATQMKGWGDSTCIGPQGMTEPLLKLVRQKAYYTEYPRTDDGSIICSTAAAQKAGLYVATPEIQAEILKREQDDAAFIVRACNAHDALAEYFHASQSLQMTMGHPEASVDDENKAEARYEAAAKAARDALARKVSA